MVHPRHQLLGLVQLIISVNDLDDGTEGTISKFAGDTGDTPDCCAVIQWDLARLEKSADGNPCQDLQSLASEAGEPQAPAVGARRLEIRSLGQAPS